MTREIRTSLWKRLTFSRSDSLSLVLSLLAFAIGVTVILLGLAYVAFTYYAFATFD